eukprot:c10119_g1_i2.p1 GENE.c10119_g1_i2~~c10119_g1_i2.p1  ORF type:complete len:302 (+),score=58.14 c10119_g1_i2:65-907(+)
MFRCYKTSKNKPPRPAPVFSITDSADENGSELAAFRELRDVKAFSNLSNETILRFLRYKDNNIRQARHMLSQHALWVERYQPNTILLDFVREQVKWGSCRIMGCDKSQRPILWMQLQYWHPESCSLEQYVLLLAWFTNQIAIMCKKCPSGQCVIVMDFSGWKRSHGLYVKHAQEYINTTQKQIPYLIHRSFLVRANWKFHQAWKVLKGFCLEEHRAKIVFVSDDVLHQTLAQHIDVDVLPKVYGGTAKIPPCPNIPGIDNIDEAPSEPDDSTLISPNEQL